MKRSTHVQDSTDLPLVDITGPEQSKYNFKHNDPPPLPVPTINVDPIPSVPSGSSRISVNPGPGTLARICETTPEDSLVQVSNGDYPESIKIEKNLHFVAQGKVRILSDTKNDVVTIDTQFASFKGFTFIQEESQAQGAIMVNSGSCLFENCTFSANFMPTITVKNDGKIYMVNCTVEARDQTSFEVRDNAMVNCKNCTFKSQKGHGVLLRNSATGRFTGCRVDAFGQNKTGFSFTDTTNFLFEDATVDKPLVIRTESKLAVVQNCKFNRQFLKVIQNSTPYIVKNTFNDCGVDCGGGSGVRLKDNVFSNNGKMSPYMIHEGATVESHNDVIKQCHAGAAALIYNQGSLKVNDFAAYDLAGVGFFAYESTKLELVHSAIVNATNGGIVCQKECELKISDTILDRINNVGVLLNEPRTAEILRSKFTRCTYSAIEVNKSQDVTIDHCIFQDNSQCGLLIVESTVSNINQCDFLSNKYAGIDARQSNVQINRSIAVSNAFGGFAFRNGTRAVIDGGAVGDNRQFGIGVEDTGSDVTAKSVEIIGNDGFGAYAGLGGRLTIEKCKVTLHDNIAVEADGEGSQITFSKAELSRNGTAVQVNDNAMVDITDECVFTDNGAHLEVAAKATASRNSLFQQSRNGVAIAVVEGGELTLDDCTVSDEATCAVSNAGKATIRSSKIMDCGVCGLFWTGEHASGDITNNEILRNGPCGIEIMGGSCNVSDNEIKSHSAFGIHVDKSAELTENGNDFEKNTVANVNRAEEAAK